MAQIDIVTVGNAVIDAFLSFKDTNKSARINHETNELCFPYGHKVLLDDCQMLEGGNACNVAVGLSRQGFQSAIVAEVGDDEFSEKILNTFRDEHVSLDYIRRTQNSRSSFSIGVHFQGERTLFVDHVSRRHDFDFTNVSARWMYLTSVGYDWMTAYARALSYVQTSGCKLAFNPGTVQIAEGLDGILPPLRYCSYLFLNLDEARKLLKLPDNAEPATCLKSLKALGPETVVITDGLKGAYAINETEIASLPAARCPVIEKTGAGDAYSTGFLAATLCNRPMKEAMVWGAISAASVIGQVGAQAGLLTRTQIEEKIPGYPDFH